MDFSHGATFIGTIDPSGEDFSCCTSSLKVHCKRYIASHTEPMCIDLMFVCDFEGKGLDN